MQCFEPTPDFDRLDRQAFKFQHKLLGHPALSLQNLAEVLPALPAKDVYFSKEILQNGDDFEKELCGHVPNRRPIEEIIENIRVSDSYVMVDGPEKHPSFAQLYKELISDVSAIMRRSGVGQIAIDPRLYLFIASPNSVTPFHIDRYASFLMQFRGSKDVTVFPQWDERVVSPEHREAYVSHINTKLPWKKEHEALATTFAFKPGETIHTPFTAGHHVKNGPDDVSISMSIFFNTPQNIGWREALQFNHRARPLLRRLGMVPVPVGRAAWRDNTKAGVIKAIRRAKQLVS
ncbi:MAG: transcriptional regulator [Variovorax sp.]|nr:MAG: transcriptional regulator [Variovorax sp.]